MDSNCAFNYVFVGLGDETINVSSVGDVTLEDLKNRIEQRGVDTSRYSFYHNGCPISDSESLTVSEAASSLVMIRAYPRVLGGKGGFGALIRSMGSQMSKNRSRDACRDLSGRRMRDVNAEKKMSEWMKNEPERKRNKAQEKKRKRDRLLALEDPRHFFNDPQYMQKLEESGETMSESLKVGLQAASSSSGKRVSNEEAEGPSKKSKLWSGLEEYGELDSGGEDEGTSSSAGGSGDSPGAGSPREVSSSETNKQVSSSPDHETTPTEQCSSEPTEESTTTEENVTCETARTATTEKANTSECTEKPIPEPIKLDEYDSVEALESAGGDRLKVTLQSMGLKCGGTVRERAERLLSVEGKQPDEIKPSLFAKPNKGKGKAKSQTT